MLSYRVYESSLRTTSTPIIENIIVGTQNIEVKIKIRPIIITTGKAQTDIPNIPAYLRF